MGQLGTNAHRLRGCCGQRCGTPRSTPADGGRRLSRRPLEQWCAPRKSVPDRRVVGVSSACRLPSRRKTPRRPVVHSRTIPRRVVRYPSGALPRSGAQASPRADGSAKAGGGEYGREKVRASAGRRETGHGRMRERPRQDAAPARGRPVPSVNGTGRAARISARPAQERALSPSSSAPSFAASSAAAAQASPSPSPVWAPTVPVSLTSPPDVSAPAAAARAGGVASS